MTPEVKKYLSKNGKKRWANVSKEERKRIMSERAKQRWAKTTKEQRKEYSAKMHLAKNKYV